MKSIQAAKDYSNLRIDELRLSLRGLAKSYSNVTVVIVGSLARRDASAESDIDYFAIVDGDDSYPDLMADLGEEVKKLGFKPPAADGAFASVLKRSAFLESIGGAEETNGDLTRRMLYLLESDWVIGENIYKEIFEAIIGAYISDNITQHQLARFFLNDLIRYYRTICVDFEYKTSGNKKSWGDRNLKLLFSRKLMYFSGVLVAAETAQSTASVKKAELARLLAMSPCDRLSFICGNDALKALEHYDKFLEWMSDKDRRDLLRSTTPERGAQDEKFREMKNVAHHFSWSLQSLFMRTYPPSHPIHQAIML